MWNLPPPPHFQGLRDDLPLNVYVRHLPHWRQDGATYFVTFRLIDALPKTKLRELEHLRIEWERHECIPHSFRDAVASSTLRFKERTSLEELYDEAMRRVDQRLDEGMGSCVLKHRVAADTLVECLHYFDDKRYELGCYVIMPNHVHAIVTPLPYGKVCISNSHNEDNGIQCFPLERILQTWKRRSSFEINRQLRCSGSLWQEESYDRIIRDEEHLFTMIQYIGANPENAGLRRKECPMWIRPSWSEIGYRIERVS